MKVREEGKITALPSYSQIWWHSDFPLEIRFGSEEVFWYGEYLGSSKMRGRETTQEAIQ
jgi:hypothetical protein